MYHGVLVFVLAGVTIVHGVNISEAEATEIKKNESLNQNYCRREVENPTNLAFGDVWPALDSARFIHTPWTFMRP